MPEACAETRLTEAQAIALSYRAAARGDCGAALVQAIRDGLADIDEAQRRLVEQGRLVSHGYARAGVGMPARDAVA